MSTHPVPLSIVALCLIGVMGCSGDKPPAPSPSPPTPEPVKSAAKPVPAMALTAKPDGSGVVRITGDDIMKFNVARIEVKAGERVKLELKHIGKLAKEVMGHNLVVLTAGADPMAFAQAAVGAAESDYIPELGKAQIIAYTKLLGGGESDTIEFDLPGPGEYPFLCSYPGHAALMKGVLVAR